jgi:hypothetical protein
MNDEQIKKIIDGSYDDAKEDSVMSMAKDFYSRRMLGTAIMVWAWAIMFFAGTVYSAVQFFKADATKSEIMYAAIFVSCVFGIGLMKVFAWEMVHRHSIKREIKRLELRIAEVTDSLAERTPKV